VIEEIELLTENEHLKNLKIPLALGTARGRRDARGEMDQTARRKKGLGGAKAEESTTRYPLTKVFVFRG